jgi:hypothetical protein
LTRWHEPERVPESWASAIAQLLLLILVAGCWLVVLLGLTSVEPPR